MLAVGDSTEVELIFNTGHYSSKTTKTASILSNSAVTSPALTISAFPVKAVDSLALFTVTPPAVSLDSLRPEAQKHPWEYEFTVRNVSDEEIDLTLVSAPREYMSVEMPGGSIAPGKEKTIKVKLEHGISDQIFNKSFTFEASDSAKTRYSLPIQKAMRWGPTPTSSF